MTRAQYAHILGHMRAQMPDSAHDEQHIWRVLNSALIIAEGEAIDRDALIAACLLHDIGRAAEYRDPALCHAQLGAEMARDFLVEAGWSADFARRVADIIRTHRFRSDGPPQTLEAQILFDADKLDAAGALGLARTLMHSGARGEPIYTEADLQLGAPRAGASDSFVSEYRFKLRDVYAVFYTRRARAMAEARRSAAEDFFGALMGEVGASREKGGRLLEKSLIDG